VETDVIFWYTYGTERILALGFDSTNRASKVRTRSVQKRPRANILPGAFILLGAKNTVLVTFSVFSLKNSPAGALALPFRVLSRKRV